MSFLCGYYHSSTVTALELKPSLYMQYRSTRSTNELLVRKGYSNQVPPRIIVRCSLTSSRQSSQSREREREMAKEKQRYSGVEEMGIVAVEPRPNKGVASKVMDCVEKLIVKFMHYSSTPNHYISGNFTPLPHETPPTTDLLVKGFLPDCLNGEFVRVGPNPKFEPVAGHHLFDGDGYTTFYCLFKPVFLSSFLEERLQAYYFSTIFSTPEYD